MIKQLYIEPFNFIPSNANKLEEDICEYFNIAIDRVLINASLEVITLYNHPRQGGFSIINTKTNKVHLSNGYFSDCRNKTIKEEEMKIVSKMFKVELNGYYETC